MLHQKELCLKKKDKPKTSEETLIIKNKIKKLLLNVRNIN